ncbi:MAG: MmgE/PrpD family protein [Alphaproteobacteria bacterium]|nr:MmgE/PrpD family protein [Alphaproteobacteria bacterium]
MALKSITRTLAAEVLATTYGGAPSEAQRAIKSLVIDHIGIAYMGHAFVGKELARYARDVGGRADAVLIGEGVRVPAEFAAAVNAQNARNTDYEDTGPGLHPGPLVVHTALAMGQRCGASGAKVLSAAMAGYLLSGRFHFSRRKDIDLPQMSTCAAAISGYLLGFDEDQMSSALSLAWEFPHRPNLYNRPKIRKRASAVGYGNLFFCRNGIQAALMTAAGLRSVPDEIDQHAADYDSARLTDPTRPYHYLSQTMQLKPWVTSRFAQSVIQTLGELVREHRIDPASVTRLRVYLPSIYLIPLQFEPSPDTYFEAIYSVHWAVAMAVLGVPTGTSWVTKERLADPVSRRMAAMVEVIEDPESTKAFNELRWLDISGAAEIEAGGNVYRGERRLRDTYGSPAAPMTQAMVENKFMDATSRSMPAAKARTLFAALQTIERVADVNDIAKLM